MRKKIYEKMKRIKELWKGIEREREKREKEKMA